jgi:hypothetical protein
MQAFADLLLHKYVFFVFQSMETTENWAGLETMFQRHSAVLFLMSSQCHPVHWEMKEKANGNVSLGTETKMKRNSTEKKLRFWNQKDLGSFFFPPLSLKDL